MIPMAIKSLPCGIVLISVALALPGIAKEAAVVEADLAPIPGPAANYPSLDSIWDLVFFSDVEATCGDNQIVGCAFADGKFFISGGNNGVNPNKLYILDSTGTLLATINQPTTTSWGWRDMAFDGTYLYAGDNGSTIYAFDSNGNLVPSMNIPRPTSIAMIRALAYDPATDHFWTGNFSANIVELNRNGTIIFSGSPAPLSAIYGMAWDDVSPGGPWLWIYDQGGTPGTTLHKYNPITHTYTGEAYTVPLIPGSIDQRAGGCEITDQWDPQRWTMMAITQGVPHDMLYVLEIMNKSAPAAPTDLSVNNNGPALLASLSWTNPTVAINGNPLTAIDTVRVLRNDLTVANLGGAPGEYMTYNDNVFAVGMYDYAVFCISDSGYGMSAEDSAWIGLDVPGPVSSLIGTGLGTSLVATLSWVNPTSGAHGGYWPLGSITGYIIQRYGPSSATFNLSGITTGYTDNTIPMQGWYYYSVLAQNSSGNGPPTATPSFYVGPQEISSIPYDWEEIAGIGSNTGITLDDQNLGPFPIGFTFTYYGNAYTQIRICSNGFASFTSTSSAYINTAIPNTAAPNNAIYPLWDDLYPPGGGTIWYYYDAANQRFMVEWNSVMTYASPRTPQKFEMILYPNGNIDFMYHTVQAPCINSNTVGKENSAGTSAVQATFNGSGPLNPASQTGIRLYGPPAPAPNVTITLTPENPPILIPVTGGSFDFTVALANNESMAQTFDAWIMVVLPDGSYYGPVLGPVNLTLPGGASITRQRTQFVPASAPAGEYIYRGFTGEYNTAQWDSSSFAFIKLTVGKGVLVGDWGNDGESFDQWLAGSIVQIPDAYAICAPYPNPFNATTVLRYQLPVAGHVQLGVYDISGRLVSMLVDGWRQAGPHEVIFDGSELASGICLAKLEAGNFVGVQKMALIK